MAWFRLFCWPRKKLVLEIAEVMARHENSEMPRDEGGVLVAFTPRQRMLLVMARGGVPSNVGEFLREEPQLSDGELEALYDLVEEKAAYCLTDGNGYTEYCLTHRAGRYYHPELYNPV
ncbi:MAG: hypothetical protein GC129_02700 [Proteobacteria bacterium]|nr:hypothetical protein [Pseudomonadota bacterium]